MKQHIVVVLCCCVWLGGCNDTNERRGYTLTGTIRGALDSTTIYLYDLHQQANIDSATIFDETFLMEGTVTQPTHGYLRFSDNPNYANLMIENTSIQFEAPLNDMLYGSRVSGGKEQALNNQLWELTRPFDRICASLNDSLLNELYLTQTHKEALIKRHRQNSSKSMELMRRFIITHPNSYLTLDLLYRNRQHIPRQDLISAYQNIAKEFKHSPDAQGLRKFIFDEEDQAEVGEDFVDFQAKDLAGEVHKLSDFKGTFVYLSFWSAGCIPCRKENKFFSENFQGLPNDLNLVSFSIDSRERHWRNASITDSIKWTNLSDLKGPKGPVARAYNVVALPHSFLIGKDGKKSSRHLLDTPIRCTKIYCRLWGSQTIIHWSHRDNQSRQQSI